MPQQHSGHYSVWSIQENDFPKNSPLEAQLQFVLGYAILAPSTHNTQPWLFSVQGNKITFLIDPARVLPASDKEGREAYISMGACVENFLMAAPCFGFKTNTVVFDLPANPGAQQKPFPVCECTVERVSANGTHEQQKLCTSIPERRSARGLYTDVKLDPPVLHALKNLAGEPGIVTTFFDDEKQRARLADAVEEGTLYAFSNPAFGKELSRWITHNWTKRPDGMPGFTVGMPGPVSLIAPKILGLLNMGAIQGKEMKKAIMQTPTVCVISGMTDTPTQWFAAGRQAERVCVHLAQFGFVTSIMAAPVEFGHIADKWGMELGVSGRPLIFFRVGKVRGEVPVSPRRNVTMCLWKE